MISKPGDDLETSYCKIFNILKTTTGKVKFGYGPIYNKHIKGITLETLKA
jgi:hypothetical protein